MLWIVVSRLTFSGCNMMSIHTHSKGLAGPRYKVFLGIVETSNGGPRAVEMMYSRQQAVSIPPICPPIPLLSDRLLGAILKGPVSDGLRMECAAGASGNCLEMSAATYFSAMTIKSVVLLTAALGLGRRICLRSLKPQFLSEQTTSSSLW